MVDKVKVLDGGQIVIPESIRTKLGISIGDELIISRKNREFRIELDDDFEDVLKMSEYSLREVWDNGEDEKWTQELIKANVPSFKEI